jgi:hypothetical protein
MFHREGWLVRLGVMSFNTDHAVRADQLAIAVGVRVAESAVRS